MYKARFIVFLSWDRLIHDGRIILPLIQIEELILLILLRCFHANNFFNSQITGLLEKYLTSINHLQLKGKFTLRFYFSFSILILTTEISFYFPFSKVRIGSSGKTKKLFWLFSVKRKLKIKSENKVIFL